MVMKIITTNARIINIVLRIIFNVLFNYQKLANNKQSYIVSKYNTKESIFLTYFKVIIKIPDLCLCN
jgi:hypothetical protein